VLLHCQKVKLAKERGTSLAQAEGIVGAATHQQSLVVYDGEVATPETVNRFATLQANRRHCHRRTVFTVLLASDV